LFRVAAVLIGCPGFVGSMEPQITGAEAISMYRFVMAGKLRQ